ncbi:hypothetical protein Cgig2_028498 [Carnegiea gigantea]|uniref:PDZ domain-containing protein n=1 Tax=Carnegiea gigantea TaxID=171969 RepID=A0A9Q1Q852_9CARY|nr:hypothetical protein Cgig2_028498 [Carnegiea gigantea]
MADPLYSLEAQNAEDAKVNAGQRAGKQLGRTFCSTGQSTSLEEKRFAAQKLGPGAGMTRSTLEDHVATTLAGLDILRPCHGIRLSDLYALDVALLEKIVQNPAACRGVIVEKVKKGSPAELAGILPYDAIVQFGGSAVESSLKLFDSMWDKIGESVEVEVIRATGKHEKLSIVVQDTDPQRYYR